MKIRKSSTSRRTRRQKLLLQILTSMGACVGVSAGAAEWAYYAPHPADQSKPAVTTVADETVLVRTQPPLQDTLEFEGSLEFQDVESPPPPPAEAIDPVVIDPPLSEQTAPVQDFPEDNLRSDSDQVLPDPATELDQPILESDISAIVDAAEQAPAMAPPTAPSMNVNRRRSSFGTTRASYATAPNMIGDHFGGLLQIGSIAGATIALAGGDRRFKVAENVSPIPQDRLFFNYNHFENALTDANGDSHALDRFALGFEKTFLCGLASLETRVPVSAGLDSRQTLFDPDTQDVEFGNIAMALKGILLSGESWLISGGVSMTLPTGEDYELFFAPGVPAVKIENDAVHLAPFLGYLVQPNCHWFAQGFVQADFDLHGNDVVDGFGFVGTLQDQNLLFLDASIGRWLHRNCDPCSCLNGVAAIAELHYTTTLNDTDSLSGISNPFNRMDVLNATGALAFQFTNSTLRVGGAAPLRDDEERLFDAEIIVQLNRFF